MEKCAPLVSESTYLDQELVLKYLAELLENTALHSASLAKRLIHKFVTFLPYWCSPVSIRWHRDLVKTIVLYCIGEHIFKDLHCNVSRSWHGGGVETCSVCIGCGWDSCGET